MPATGPRAAGRSQEVAEHGDIPGPVGFYGAVKACGNLPDPALGQHPAHRRGVRGEAHGPGAGTGRGRASRRRTAPAGTSGPHGPRATPPHTRPGRRLAKALAHEEAGVAEPVEEIRIVVGVGGGGTDGALQGLAGGPGQASAGCLLGLASERAAAEPTHWRCVGRPPDGRPDRRASSGR